MIGWRAAPPRGSVVRAPTQSSPTCTLRRRCFAISQGAALDGERVRLRRADSVTHAHERPHEPAHAASSHWRPAELVAQAALSLTGGARAPNRRDPVHASHYESGKREPRLAIFLALLEALDVEPATILGP